MRIQITKSKEHTNSKGKPKYNVVANGKYLGRFDTKREAEAAASRYRSDRTKQAHGTRYERAARNPGLFGGIFLNR